MKHKIILFTSLFISLLYGGCSVKIANDTVINVGDKDGLLKDNGDVVIKPIYKRINSFQGEFEKYPHPNLVNLHWIEDDKDKAYAIVENIDGKFGVIDKQGNLKLKVVYDSIGSFFNGFAKIEINKKFGLIDKEFNIVLKPIYDEIEEFVFHTAIVKQNEKYGCIDKDIHLKIKPLYDRIYVDSEGMKRIELDDKWGFVDGDCNVVAKPIYDYAYDFKNGFAKVKKAQLWGYLDQNGNLLTNTIFTDPDNF